MKQVDAIVSQAGAEAEKVMLPDCAHIPHKEAAEATFETMWRFIAGLTTYTDSD
ncbi:hypothetical protein [Deinococcus sp.]|uniref:hypothetical protein n=1 Tax=Deinococcus sp. TaxID=47478 RepID=UPI0025C01454|nr:hypothetical protein [Deinococcus sp.]